MMCNEYTLASPPKKPIGCSWTPLWAGYCIMLETWSREWKFQQANLWLWVATKLWLIHTNVDDFRSSSIWTEVQDKANRPQITDHVQVMWQGDATRCMYCWEITCDNGVARNEGTLWPSKKRGKGLHDGVQGSSHQLTVPRQTIPACKFVQPKKKSQACPKRKMPWPLNLMGT